MNKFYYLLTLSLLSSISVSQAMEQGDEDYTLLYTRSNKVRDYYALEEFENFRNERKQASIDSKSDWMKVHLDRQVEAIEKIINIKKGQDFSREHPVVAKAWETFNNTEKVLNSGYDYFCWKY